ncbi:putative tRNA-binding protein [Spiroplasma syrphidicola EA-1]|uniref:Putative tRNA-binding protein n=1 Tax=Spiroplasma syrphidicola EA-1 TaxID=1276229 RepID=R4UEZ1_9MOLU|nr:tRNA-binding protein [Spiroplasma syrphidicola]AGM26494.1 putative tRNA-binding protein [Spiroplasma syrphidicola EA-1]
MNKKTIGLFYNLGFDTLFGYVKDFDHKNSTQDGDLTIFYDQENQFVGFNLLNASKKITSELYHGINSDNQRLIAELGSVLKLEAGLWEQYNQEPQFLVGEINSRVHHPNSDKLSICQVNLGQKNEQIVCGAPNCDQNQKVVVATIGAIMPNLMKIVPSELRGEQSNGMLCSARELGIANDNLVKGLLILDDQQYHTGNSFWKEYYNEQN